MEFKDATYNPLHDLQPVEQTGFVDLRKANAMNAIPATLTADSLSYNEIDDPNSIGGRPSDVFEGAQMGKQVVAHAAAVKAAADAAKGAPKTE